MSIAENIQHLRQQIPGQVTLIAVSKTKPDEDILSAYAAGQRDFGENYVQEMVAKAEILPKDIRWHFIGHLQSNKVKYIVPFVHLIHGVDSFKLLKEINKQAAKFNRVIPCLLQVFIAKEESKFGLDDAEVREIMNENMLSELKNIKIAGFMGMASNTNDETIVRKEFHHLKQLASEFPQCNIISMGMSSDFPIAIEEGSTMIRVGSLIFGKRNYNQ